MQSILKDLFLKYLVAHRAVWPFKTVALTFRKKYLVIRPSARVDSQMGTPAQIARCFLLLYPHHNFVKTPRINRPWLRLSSAAHRHIITQPLRVIHEELLRIEIDSHTRSFIAHKSEFAVRPEHFPLDTLNGFLQL
jgi:hypothetical protein